jgi:hypothetical protein
MKEIEEAIRHLEAGIVEFRESPERWDQDSVNSTGAKKYKEKVRRIVLQAEEIESLVRENVFPK